MRPSSIALAANVCILIDGSARWYKNLVTQTGLDWALSRLAKDPPWLPEPITHVAVGDDGRESSLGDDQLWNELARKPYSRRETDEGALIVEAFFDRDEANFVWREAGLIAGGTDDPGTGVLVARVVVDEYKDTRRTAVISWEIGVRNA